MGSDKDFKNMVEFINDYEINPVIDEVFSAKDAMKAFERMNSAGQFGKIIIKF